MNKYIILSVLLLVTLITVNAKNYVVYERTGLIINYSTSDDMFPESWRGGDIEGQAEDLDESEYHRTMEIIFKALDKYPVEVINENLKCIYVFKYMEFYNQSFGGTNSTEIVYLTNKGPKHGYSDTYLEQLFHAEFSSILLRNFAGTDYEEKWSTYNVKDFIYGSGGVKELKTGKAGLDYSEVYFNTGFLYEYGMSGMENDFNSISKNLFLPHHKFWSEALDHDIIRDKVLLTLKLYHQIHPDFTINYFREFAVKED